MLNPPCPLVDIGVVNAHITLVVLVISGGMDLTLVTLNLSIMNTTMPECLHSHQKQIWKRE